MNDLSSNQFFVYSSLRKGFNLPAYEYIAQYFEFVGEGTVNGILSDTGNMAVGTPTHDHHFIKGELYRLKNDRDFEWAFAQLDGYEGVSSTPDEPVHYRREIVSVILNDNQVTESWIYWYNGDVRSMPIIESGDILEYFKSKAV
ncbi:MAG: gamma-glutamylcyclotransferase [Bacteroidetes bacterium]|nr:gamma-glutamylcyclotransferase [Bacteroidota bacterium]